MEARPRIRTLLWKAFYIFKDKDRAFRERFLAYLVGIVNGVIGRCDCCGQFDREPDDAFCKYCRESHDLDID